MEFTNKVTLSSSAPGAQTVDVNPIHPGSAGVNVIYYTGGSPGIALTLSNAVDGQLVCVVNSGSYQVTLSTTSFTGPATIIYGLSSAMLIYNSGLSRFQRLE